MLGAVAETLDNSRQYELAEEELNPGVESGDDERVTLDDSTDVRYEAYSEMWSEAIEDRTL